MGEHFIDINSDLGESAEALANGSDFDLMRFISSANIACGGHAGDESTMRKTLAAAKELSLAVGAHPSYPDRANFGRIAMPMSAAEIEITVRQQIEQLASLADEAGMKLVHVKPHGALYHAARDWTIAAAIGKAARSVDPQLVMVGQAGSPAVEHWQKMGFRCVGEAFADRRYERDGTLRSRTMPGALLASPADAARQALAIARDHVATIHNGSELAIVAETLCIHSDTPGAAAIAQEVKRQLLAAGFVVRSLA
jgi:5-oxoprolinase (ATP-hydrolysing) subunit A